MAETILSWIGVGLIGTFALALITIIVLGIIVLIKITKDM